MLVLRSFRPFAQLPGRLAKGYKVALLIWYFYISRLNLMKRTPILLLWLLILSSRLIAQSISSVNCMTTIKKFDLSKLWRATSIVIHSSDGVVDNDPFPFPEPMRYIGVNYQRFYIHYTSVKKDAFNPYRYFVKGKTRVNNHICNFSGTIIVKKVVPFKESDDPRYKEGVVICKVDFKEDSSQAQSGYIKGMLVSDWCLDKQHRLLYDAINFIADGYSNN